MTVPATGVDIVVVTGDAVDRVHVGAGEHQPDPGLPGLPHQAHAPVLSAQHHAPEPLHVSPTQHGAGARLDNRVARSTENVN